MKKNHIAVSNLYMAIKMELAEQRNVREEVHTEMHAGHVRQLAHTIKLFYLEFIKTYGDIIHHQITVYANLVDKYEELSNCKTLFEMNKIIVDIDKLHQLQHAHPATYLLRHPERYKPKGHGDNNPTESKQFTEVGEFQAKEFAKFIVDEALAQNKPVHIQIEYSPFIRTRLNAEIIQEELNDTLSKYYKKFRVRIKKTGYLDGNHIKDCNDETWFKELNSKFVSGKTIEWVHKKQKKYKNYYVIRIGITHMPNVAAFLVHAMNMNATFAQHIHYTYFVRFLDQKFVYHGGISARPIR